MTVPAASLGGRRRDLDDRDELEEARAELVAEVAVDLERVLLVRGVHRAQHVELGAVLLEQARGGLDLVEHRAPCAVVAVRVVKLARPVDAQAHEHVVLGEERGPLVVEQRAVRLDRALDLPPRGQCIALDLERAAEEVEAHERGLAALPRERHERHPLRLDRLPNERVHDLVGHLRVAAGVERRLLQEEAVVAAQVAPRPGGLGHDVECLGGARRS